MASDSCGSVHHRVRSREGLLMTTRNHEQELANGSPDAWKQYLKPVCEHCGAVEGVSRHRGLCPNNNHEVIEISVGAEPSWSQGGVL